MLGCGIKEDFREQEIFELGCETCIGFPQMARVREKGALRKGNNKFSDQEGWTHVTMIGGYSSSGMTIQHLPGDALGKKSILWPIIMGDASCIPIQKFKITPNFSVRFQGLSNTVRLEVAHSLLKCGHNNQTEIQETQWSAQIYIYIFFSALFLARDKQYRQYNQIRESSLFFFYNLFMKERVG